MPRLVKTVSIINKLYLKATLNQVSSLEGELEVEQTGHLQAKVSLEMVQQQLATEKETFEQEAAKLRQSLADQTQGMAELEQRVAASVADKQASAAGPQAAMEELVRHCSMSSCFVANVYPVMCRLCYAVMMKD